MLDLLKILFLMLVIQGSVIGQEDRDTLSFLHISDVHFCNLNGYHTDFVEKRQHYGGIADSFQTWIRKMPKKKKADFVVITGDMIDFYEAESKDGSLLGAQVEQFVALT